MSDDLTGADEVIRLIEDLPDRIEALLAGFANEGGEGLKSQILAPARGPLRPSIGRRRPGLALPKPPALSGDSTEPTIPSEFFDALDQVFDS